MRKIHSYAAAALIAGVAAAGTMLVAQNIHAQTSAIPDEAQRAGRDAASFPQATEDYFHDMDNGVALSADEVQGRNMWLVWSGGNDRFWDVMIKHAFGTFDLLKLIDSTRQFRRSEFTLPIAHAPNGETFSIHSAREGVAP